MKQRILSSALTLCFTFLLAFNQNLFAQFETSVGLPIGLETSFEGKQIPGTDHFLSLGTTGSAAPADRILLTEYDVTGAVVNYMTIFDPANPTDKYYGQSFDFVDPATPALGLYIVGTRVSSTATGGTQMIVMRTSLTGIVMWSQHVFTNTIYQDKGVSCERQANGDIIAIGEGTDMTVAAPNTHQIVVRLSAVGGLIWHFRYMAPAGFRMIPAESCNGRRTVLPNIDDVVAITGRMEDPTGFIQTYASCIRAADGLEFWRRTYTSTYAATEGLDIVQMPTGNARFAICGRASATSGSHLWMVYANSTNGAGSGAGYTQPGVDFAGRDICLGSTTGATNNRLMVSGTVRIPTTTGGVAARVFLMRLPFILGAVPNYTRQYIGSSPIATGSESVNRVVAAGAAVNGYFITSTHLPTSWPAGSAHAKHAIYTDLNGLHGVTGDCPILNLLPVATLQGTSISLARPKIVTDLLIFPCGQNGANFLVAACDGVAPAPRPDAAADRAFQIIGTDETIVSPNPISAGENLRVEFMQTTENETTISFFAPTGQLVSQSNIKLSVGRQMVEIPTDNLNSGLYILKLKSGEFEHTAKVIVKE